MIEYLKDIIDLTPYIGTDAFCGIRINPIRITDGEFFKVYPKEAKKCEFHEHGYRIPKDDKCGNDLLHIAGAYYIQEPSAMSAVTALDVQPDDVVLDACAAPGSKATDIASRCNILIANEINGARAGVLLSNIERMGISNALIVSSDLSVIGEKLEGYCDKVLVDSPCSGEGMFRKHPEILDNWSTDLVKMCAKRSAEVLKNASRALAVGGRLVYSTCTFNTEENEKVIIDFLQNNPDFELADTGLSFGNPGLLGLTKARRITPEHGGEGHFVCALKRVSGNGRAYPKPFKLKYNFDFLKSITDLPPVFSNGKDKRYGVLENGGTYYAIPDGVPFIKGVHIMRAGVKLGNLVSKTFKPEHHLFMASDVNSVCNTVRLTKDEAYGFMSGRELCTNADIKGYCAVIYNGLCLGFGKASGGVIKNHLPKGLRI